VTAGENDGVKGSGRPKGAAEAFFGRRKNKPLRAAQQALYEALLPALRLDLAEPCAQGVGALFPHGPAVVRLEIGFGGGEHLAHEAVRHPAIGYIGAEVFLNGVARMLQHVDALGLANVRIFDEDAVRLLDWLPEGSLDRVDLLYPDPWPKKRHWKRRFVSHANLDRIARALKSGGEFRFASDIADYVDWTIGHCAGHPAFGPPSMAGRPAHEPWEGWLRTRYEAKAVREGRTPAYLSFRRS
jgi:tRNA (guanine-N7-)-methyltransferase